jgi:DHA3 family macrolide efflux protein-like MFS transporter
MVLGGILLSVWGGFKRRIVTAMLALSVQGVGFMLVGFTPVTAFGVAVIAFFIVGIMNPIVNGSFMAVLQTTVPAEMQGRVFTLVGSATAAATPLGLVIAGPVADAVGVQFWFIVAGVTMIMMAVAGLLIPDIANIEETAGSQAKVAKTVSAAVTEGYPLAGVDVD